MGPLLGAAPHGTSLTGCPRENVGSVAQQAWPVGKQERQNSGKVDGTLLDRPGRSDFGTRVISAVGTCPPQKGQPQEVEGLARGLLEKCQGGDNSSQLRASTDPTTLC